MLTAREHADEPSTAVRTSGVKRIGYSVVLSPASSLWNILSAVPCTNTLNGISGLPTARRAVFTSHRMIGLRKAWCAMACVICWPSLASTLSM